MKNIALGLMFVATLGFFPVSAFAQGDGTGRFEERKPEVKPTLVALDATAIACIKTAVIKREDALIAGFDVYAAALKSARMIRKDALSAAWDKTVASERRMAVKSADRTFAEASKAARKAWNDSRRATWKSFEADRRACNVTGVSASDTGSSITDAAL